MIINFDQWKVAQDATFRLCLVVGEGVAQGDAEYVVGGEN